MPFGIKEYQLNKIKEILLHYPGIHDAVLFGSRAKGINKKGADIDIALKGKNLTVNDIITLQQKLEELWLPYKFDLILYRNIDEPSLAEHIKRVGVSLFDKDF